MKSIHLVSWLACALLSAGCRTLPAESRAEREFASLEERLLAARHVEVEFEITSEGAVESQVSGLLMVEGDVVALFADGELMGRPAQVELLSTDRELRGGRDVGQVLGPRPEALREGVLLGLTRMGLLHNIAVLAAGQPPDGVGGEVRSWARVGELVEEEGGIAFELTVAGRKAGSARLRLTDGLPVEREQIVRFPGGEMRVVERYRSFVVR